MKFPQLPNRIPQRKYEIMQIRGINYTDNFADGSMADCTNITADRYPYFATRKDRTEVTGYSNVTALYAREKLISVVGTKLYYDGVEKGTVTAGAKQFATVNTKVVIWPDKKYLDLNTLTLKNLGATASGSSATFSPNSITVAWANIDMRDYFHEGEGLTIEGCTTVPGNNLLGAVVVDVSEHTIIFKAETFVMDAEEHTSYTESGTITISRKIPDLDFICESNNRLWGCSNTDQTIYSSALGEPTIFFNYAADSTSADAVAVGSEGNFTGCCALSSAVLFWKDHVMHKMLGSYPAEYQLYTYNIEGVKAGCSKSLVNVNDVIFYVSSHGVYTYSGGKTGKLSEALGQIDITSAVAGTDGIKYYLSAQINNAWKLFVYDTSNGLWLTEDSTQAIDFARLTDQLYMLKSDGKIYKIDDGSTPNSLTWMIQFKPFWEKVTGSYKSQSDIFERKRYTKITLRCELPQGSTVSVYYRTDGGSWIMAQTVNGSLENIIRIPVSTPRCDKFEMKLSGVGMFALHEIAREFKVGSDR